MLRWLPVRLRRLYERLVAARPHTRARRVPPIPAEPPPSCGRDRKHRLDVVYDAFCERRPAPRHLFRPNYIPRDMRSWCDQPHPRTDKPQPRCPSCERARALYLEAVGGNEEADRRLHRLARRGAVRLLAERRRYRAERAPMLAAQREQRAAERARYGPQPEPFEITLWPSYRPSGPGAHHAHARRDVERGLVRDHAALLRVLLRRRSARLRVLGLARNAAGRTSAKQAVHQRDVVEAASTAPPQPRHCEDLGAAEVRGNPGPREDHLRPGPGSPRGV